MNFTSCADLGNVTQNGMYWMGDECEQASIAISYITFPLAGYAATLGAYYFLDSANRSSKVASRIWQNMKGWCTKKQDAIEMTNIQGEDTYFPREYKKAPKLKKVPKETLADLSLSAAKPALFGVVPAFAIGVVLLALPHGINHFACTGIHQAAPTVGNATNETCSFIKNGVINIIDLAIHKLVQEILNAIKGNMGALSG